MNILLIIIDCLRYDRVTPEYMPWLHGFGQQHTFFTNYWSTSHCTDPSITPLLSGMWPDALKLYSMMYEVDGYSISRGVEMLPQTAKKYGYETGMVSNLGRWYTWGVDRYVNSRTWHGSDIFKYADSLMAVMKPPWLMVVHDDSCHVNYRGGSYDQACREVDQDIAWLGERVLKHAEWRDNTFVIVTADHGEGLGERGIDQHGFGLWPFLTHVPLAVYSNQRLLVMPKTDQVCQPIDLYHAMRAIIGGVETEYPTPSPLYAHMVGRTKDVWHRGVTDGQHMVIKRQEIGGLIKMFYYNIGHDDFMPPDKKYYELWQEAKRHAEQFGIDADNDQLDDAILEARLRGLGYFE